MVIRSGQKVDRFLSLMKLWGNEIMDMDYIKEKLIDRVPRPMDILYKYAVLIPMININGRWEIIYEMRAETLRRQPGEISFPGGKVEKGETYKKAAIRETMEELNIGKSDIKIIGELDYLVSYSNSIIYSFLGTINDIGLNDIIPSKAEVDHIFTVPLDFFLTREPKVYYIDLSTSIGRDFPYNLIPNGMNYNWQKGKHSVYFYKYQDYVIWGYTAKLTKHFIDIIKGY